MSKPSPEQFADRRRCCIPLGGLLRRLLRNHRCASELSLALRLAGNNQGTFAGQLIGWSMVLRVKSQSLQNGWQEQG
ncbi:hypothetical protein OAU08_04225 [Porticoccaceae bacterium]|nr:hypothetical protein [Porticoccaceae bacterium]